jgi:hypothetical protein
MHTEKISARIIGRQHCELRDSGVGYLLISNYSGTLRFAKVPASQTHQNGPAKAALIGHRTCVNRTRLKSIALTIALSLGSATALAG